MRKKIKRDKGKKEKLITKKKPHKIVSCGIGLGSRAIVVVEADRSQVSRQS